MLRGKVHRLALRLSLLLLLLPAAAHAVDPATIPEVQNLQFVNDTDFVWDPLPPASADEYGVYSSPLGDIQAGNYGPCLAVPPAAAASDAAVPPLGGVIGYLATGIKSTVEGTMGFRTGPIERANLTPCAPPLPPPLGGTLDPNGPDVDGVLKGANAPRNPAIGNELNGLAGGGVYLHTLEFFVQDVDLEVPGRGINWRHARTYRSQINYDGPQGFNWTFNYDRRIMPGSVAGNLLHLDGAGRQDEYFSVAPGLFEPLGRGIYSKIRQTTDGFTLRERDGTLYHYFPLDGTSTEGKLSRIEDRYGNFLTFLYHPNGLLCNVVDTLGRTYSYYYEPGGHLESVVDYSGRELRYTYDAVGNLTAVRRPRVIGTPTGNDFPAGKTKEYTYSSGFAAPELNHNLLTVTAPGDAVPTLENFYLADDTLDRQFYGGTNSTGIPAGGLYDYAINVLGGGFREIEVIDRNGIQHLLTTDPPGHLLEETVFTIPIRPTDPPAYTTAHNYNAHGERILTIRPLGNQIAYTYDELNPDRFQQGNLLEIRRTADLARGDGFGGFLPDITVTYAYDPMYTMQRVITDPMGRVSEYTYDYQEGDPVFNGVITIATDWQINLGAVPLFVGDQNGDGLIDQIGGNPVRLDQPTVNVLPGGRQDGIGGPTQQIVTLWRYNQFGQLQVEVEPEKNVKVYSYYPEVQPHDGLDATPPPLDGRLLDPVTGGYLANVVLDADPIPHLSAADIGSRDNATNPPPAQIENQYTYDAVGNLIRSTNGKGVSTRYDVNQLGQIVQVTRDEDGFAFVSQQIYNERDEIEQRRVQDGFFVDSFFDVVYKIDLLGNVVEQTQDVDNALTATKQYRYDAQERRTATVFPEGNVFTLQHDERDLLYRVVRDDNDLDASNGGPPGSSEQFVNYDENGNPAEFVDGRGTAWEFFYDGMDRRVVSTIDPNGIGTFFTTLYNPDESRSFTIVQDGLGSTFHQTFYGYDALGRNTSISQRILDSSGAPINESVDGDSFIVTFNEYDRNSRRSRSWGDGGPALFARFEDYDYDGAGRMIQKADNAGNVIRYEYDPNNNLLNTKEEESTLVGPEIFTTEYVYDSLDRRILVTDSAGNSRSSEYDERDNVIQTTDALGNTQSYTYDGSGRRTSIVRDLRAGGTGAGTVFDQIIYGFEYDLNGRAVRLTDPEGNTTEYAYDGLDRKIRDTFADGTTMGYEYDANDNVVRVTEPNGAIIDITYDTLDRPVQRVTAGTPTVPPTTQTFSYDRFNRLIDAFDQTGASPGISVQFDYDSLNRVRSETTQVAGNPPRLLEYTYDDAGNRDTAFYPTNGVPNVLSYAYDALDRLIVTGDSQTGFVSFYDYMGPERIGTRQAGNGITKSYLDFFAAVDIGYDGIKRTRMVNYYDPGGASVTGFEYTYDSESNITSEARLHDGGQGDVWVYDSAYRMVHFKRDVLNPGAEAAVPGSGGPILRQTQYSLDRVGNWLEQIINDTITGTSGVFGNTPNLLNEYGEKPDDGVPDDFLDDLGTLPPDGINLGHDKNGNLVTEGLTTYTYDALNRLVSVSGPGGPIAEYTYDALDRRTLKFEPPAGTASRFVYDADRLITEFDFTGGFEGLLLRRYFYGAEGTPLATFDELPGQLYYLHEDARGNIRAATDAAGTVVERYTYGAYGEVEFRDGLNVPTGLSASAIGNAFLYGSQYYDPETQFYEKRGAIYAPRYGRHIQRFVPGQQQGPLGLALNPPLVYPNLLNWIGMNPWWWCKFWFWNPGAWWNGWWAWRPGWWWGGAWGWWWWRPWLWFGAPDYGWWWLRPWVFWWGVPWNWWGWQAWWGWSDWWGWWPWWGWGGWCSWFPVWGWVGWMNWWPWWGWGGWCGFWPGFGWWGWCGWWPWWNVWWGWTPYWWWGWWTWSPFWWTPYWSWSGLWFWWNWWGWVDWWPWGWWNWLGWRWWWGWAGWNPWWWWGWWGWSSFGWIWGLWWWWGPVGWWPWYGWGWIPWWWWGWWSWWGWWDWWIWPWWGIGPWGWWSWWNWWWGWWALPWWGWWRWWGWWWPWWGWWC